MSGDLKYYLAYSKGDDYGACKLELVRTTKDNAEEYYHTQEIEAPDVETLLKYFDLVDYDEESERSSEKRYYGSE